MKILVTGSRNWEDKLTIKKWLLKIQQSFSSRFLLDPLVVVHGGARGADSLAGEIAEEMDWSLDVYEADWKKHGKKAGVLRNQEMLDSADPDMVLAFPTKGSKGTWDMIKRSVAKGKPVIIISGGEEKDE